MLQSFNMGEPNIFDVLMPFVCIGHHIATFDS